ncbi:hypothetical protein [Xiashengella succiniciproducens]|jgi:hypothetical protein|uniref:STAS/SEC14 domain-containing protein n=1 Tax=Xiashengella succiniciproducens TaxID=2949635 RepID=A0A9J6ZT72_9BACT|nr:hypothetical protein [Alkaliflexus sp. Ai-910]URW80456.1 hypothetical protein M9189_03705 [Alkaliflexus sp. Ai-910]
MKETKFSYYFDEERGILFKTYYGPITIEDINSSWKFAFHEGLIPHRMKGFVLDYRSANFDVEPERHTEIAAFYKRHIEVFGGYKIAIVTEAPRDIVIPVLVEMHDEGYSSRPFSTMEAAISWVQVGFTAHADL